METEQRSDRAIYADLGRRINQIRRGKHVTQERLARSLGLSRTSVTNIERGRQPVLVHTLIAIAAELQVDITELLPDIATTATEHGDSFQPPRNVTPKEWELIQPMLGPRSINKKRKRSSQERKK